ncbi:MAG: biotin transporter BioY [Neisseriaceae bacterium]|jgi:biotin transport system substrate-specific component
MLNIINKHLSKHAMLVFSFGIALIISGQVTIPFYPVPFTLQTCIFTVAVLYNSRIAMQSTLLYVFLGIVGLPVFAEWSNIFTLIKSPSIGYVIGMVLASMLINFTNIKAVLSKITVLNIVVFTCGIIPLAYLFGLPAALHGGLLVFILPETIKTVAAYFIYRYIR